MQPLISIVVPVYNVEKYLNKCINSLVNQSYKNLELILVNDGSKDKSGNICDEWKSKDNRIKVIHKENGGLSSARNVGMDCANGDFISFVDSDDWVDKKFIECLYNQLEINHADIAACTIVKSYKNYDELQPINQKKVRFTKEEALDTLLSGRDFCAVAWNKLYKKNIIGNVRFPVGKIHEDEFFSYRVIANANILVLVPDAKYFYRQRSGSIMQEWSIAHLDVLEAFKERMDFMHTCYPNLYLKSKYSLYLASVYNAKELLNFSNGISEKEITIILEYTATLKFTLADFIKLGMKKSIFILRGRLILWKLKKLTL